MRKKTVSTKILSQIQLIAFFSLLISSPAWAGDINSDFIKAAAKDDTATVKNLLAKGADVNTKNDDGWTALMLAAKGGYIDIVKLMLTNGAEINVKNMGGFTAFMYAVVEDHNSIVKILQDKETEVRTKNIGSHRVLTYETNSEDNMNTTRLAQIESISTHVKANASTKAKERRESIRASAIRQMKEQLDRLN